jgi:hypothetical protein
MADDGPDARSQRAETVDECGAAPVLLMRRVTFAGDNKRLVCLITWYMILLQNGVLQHHIFKSWGGPVRS